MLVAIVNYNSSGHVPALLSSLVHEPIDRVVVLDNGSPGSEWTRLSDAVGPFPRATAVRSEENLGFGAGANKAVALLAPLDDDVIWVLNPDTTVASNATTYLLQTLRRGDVDLVSPLLVTGQSGAPTVWFAGGRFNLATGRARHRLWGKPLPTSPSTHPSDILTGTATMFTFRAWAALAGFREDFFLYYEDTELSLRAHTLGLHMVVDERAVVWHAGGGSAGRTKVYFHYMQRNRILLMRERGVRRRSILFGRAAPETYRLVAQAWRTGPHRSSKIAAAFRGIAAGMGRDVVSDDWRRSATRDGDGRV